MRVKNLNSSNRFKHERSDMIYNRQCNFKYMIRTDSNETRTKTPEKILNFRKLAILAISPLNS